MKIVALANIVISLQIQDAYAYKDVRNWRMCDEPKPKEEDVQKTKEERQEELRRWFESMSDCV